MSMLTEEELADHRKTLEACKAQVASLQAAEAVRKRLGDVGVTVARVLELFETVDALKADVAEAKATATLHAAALAAAEARESALREVLTKAHHTVAAAIATLEAGAREARDFERKVDTEKLRDHWNGRARAYDIARRHIDGLSTSRVEEFRVALSAPRDTAALDAMLESVRRETKDSLNEFHCRQMDALNAELAKAKKEAATHWANFCERSGDFAKWRAAENALAAERLKTAAAQARMAELRTFMHALTQVAQRVASASDERLAKYRATARDALAAIKVDQAPDDLEALREFGLKVAAATYAEANAGGHKSVVNIVDAVLRGEGGT